MMKKEQSGFSLSKKKNGYIPMFSRNKSKNNHLITFNIVLKEPK